VGNERLLVCFDENYCLRDLYFPHVGQENHIGRNFFRLGVWAEKLFAQTCDSVHGSCRIQ
jgi:hypothetical protein